MHHGTLSFVIGCAYLMQATESRPLITVLGAFAIVGVLIAVFHR